MGPCSLDLRQRIVDAYQNREGSVRELAERFHVAPNTVQGISRWCAPRRRRRAVSARRRHRPRKVDEAGEQELVALLEKKSHQTLAELVEGMERRRRVHVSVSTMSRTLERMEITRKKGRWVPASRTTRTFNRPAADFQDWAGTADPHRLIFNRRVSAPTCRRDPALQLRPGPGGETYGKAPENKDPNLTLVFRAGHRRGGWRRWSSRAPWMIVLASRSHTQEYLAPVLRPGDVVLSLIETGAAQHAHAVPLPRRSPAGAARRGLIFARRSFPLS